MDETRIRAWFGEYLDTIAALGRGESDDLAALLGFYGVPLLVASDEAAGALLADHEVLAFGRRQVDGMRAADYDHSATLTDELTSLNATSALYAAEFARRRADGSEIGRLAVAYLLTRGSVGLRISAIAVRVP